MSRVLAWFSCGAASAVAAKLTVEKYGDRAEVLYCDTLAYEHPDNARFLTDVASWLGVPITVLKSDTYTDIFDVFQRTRWLVGVRGLKQHLTGGLMPAVVLGEEGRDQRVLDAATRGIEPCGSRSSPPP